MTLSYPLLLLLAIPSAAALAWHYWRGKYYNASLIFPGNPELWSHQPSLRARLGREAAPLLKTAALFFLVLGLCRPQKTGGRLGGLGQGLDIMLAIDTSLSMNAIDFDPSNRLDAAKDTALRFIRGRVSDRIGVVVFGGATQLACPLTLDYGALSAQIAEMSAGMTHADGTAIGDGIISAVNHLKEGDGKSKIVILLTDGRNNVGLIDPLTAAKTAAAYGVKVYTIGTAKRGQALMPIDDPLRGRVMVRIDDDLDEDLLAEIAKATDGRYFRATNLRELREIYATIDKLEKSSVKLPDIVSNNDLYRMPLIFAAFLILTEAILSGTWLLRWP